MIHLLLCQSQSERCMLIKPHYCIHRLKLLLFLQETLNVHPSNRFLFFQALSFPGITSGCPAHMLYSLLSVNWISYSVHFAQVLLFDHLFGMQKVE